MYYYWAGGGAANASDCKSDGLWPSGVQVPPCPPSFCKAKTKVADVAQAVERILGKNKVSSASLLIGSKGL